MATFVFLASVCCFWQVVCQDAAFPGDASAVMSRLEAMLKDLPPPPDQEANVDRLRAQAREAILESQKDNDARQQLEEVVVDLVHKRVAQYMYTGMCLRNYSSSCPKGWRFESGHCEAPLEYVGQCRHVVAPQSDEGKAEFAQSCLASWPCAERRPLNFAGCPENWTQDGTSCVAPKSYRGICASVTDFSSYSIDARAEWSTMCQAPWPAQI